MLRPITFFLFCFLGYVPLSFAKDDIATLQFYSTPAARDIQRCDPNIRRELSDLNTGFVITKDGPTYRGTVKQRGRGVMSRLNGATLAIPRVSRITFQSDEEVMNPTTVEFLDFLRFIAVPGRSKRVQLNGYRCDVNFTLSSEPKSNILRQQPGQIDINILCPKLVKKQCRIKAEGIFYYGYI